MEKDKQFYSVSEVAKLLKISKVAVYKRIKAGKIEADRIGQLIVIPRAEIDNLFLNGLPKEKKEAIENAVKKAVEEYGETFKLLGKE
ncbi:MAG: hypothetical protein A2754_04250 [Candidatus Magasanikbacteria bacterium RIFCSPHIGHO2_01_FULL_47_8]|uniref:Helix-turn-helix domain-containing protein n=1 Tax=Candidatus Magasanikbacteria bacterium RIFCSPHIGHO2_01_FULL_47_8 TaxID=1798673 RepID=A0A1F6MDC4_9BACT|nr:MAG: hypothetical protein A2754_04250 [Candidatus Magasanikbacteria bacterium RIFCSPHIGHO2_01_FULL_47_8]